MVSEKEIRVIFSAAKIAYNNVCVLHESYVLKKINLTESEDEDNNYINDVDSSYCELLRLEESYEDQLRATSKLKTISSAQNKSNSEFERKKS